MRKTRKAARWVALFLVATVGSAVLFDALTGAWDLICSKPVMAFCLGR